MAHQQVKAVVLLSGGIDSSTALAMAISEVGSSDQVRAISVFYGQKHSREYEAAQAIASWAHVDHCQINLSNVLFAGGGSTLIDADKPNPNTTYAELSKSKGISPTYVPFRNGNILSAATALILSHYHPTQEEPILLFYGAHAEDAANWAYPDCTPEFNGAMANAIFVGSYQRVRLVTLFQWTRKHEIIQIADDLGVPLELTYSCYNGRELHCKVCPTCVARQAAFIQAGVDDPTEYEDAPEDLTLKALRESVENE